MELSTNPGPRHVVDGGGAIPTDTRVLCAPARMTHHLESQIIARIGTYYQSMDPFLLLGSHWIKQSSGTTIWNHCPLPSELELQSSDLPWLSRVKMTSTTKLRLPLLDNLQARFLPSKSRQSPRRIQCLSTLHPHPTTSQPHPQSSQTKRPTPRNLIPKQPHPSHQRNLHTTSSNPAVARPRATTDLKTKDRGPQSTEDTQTDFAALNMLGRAPNPSTSIDICTTDGFMLDSGLRVSDGDGVLLTGNEALVWRPWMGRTESEDGDVMSGNEMGRRTGESMRGLVNKSGQFEIGDEAWGIFAMLWPRPGMLSTSNTFPLTFNISPSNSRPAATDDADR